jgi:membrane protease YdiL (CAAX protease family)
MLEIEEEEISEAEHNKWLRIVVVFYGIDLVICLMANFLHFFQGLHWLLITEAVLAAITLVFVFIIRKELKPLFRWDSYTLPKATVYAGAAILFAVVVNIIIQWVNKNVFNENVYYYHSFRHLPYPKLEMIALVALLPAVFEELAYRGVILQSLFNIEYEKRAIYISAFLFAIIHMSFVSFFWLLPFAVWLGNIRWKEKTIWYGVLIHFCFNATACFFEFYELRLF